MLRGRRVCRSCSEDATRMLLTCRAHVGRVASMLRRCYEETAPVEFSL